MSTVQQIKDRMLSVLKNETVLSSLKLPSSESKSAIWDLYLYIIAVCSVDLRAYFDSHREDVNATIKNEKYGTLPWYRRKALAYQDGFDLLDESDKFDNGNATAKEIEESKIIKHAAVNEGDTPGTVIIKIATEKNNVLKPVEEEIADAIRVKYFDNIKIAGTRVVVINSSPDKLYLNMKVQVDPLVFKLDGTFKRDGTRPVESTILQFLKELPFDGELVLQDLELRLRQIEGVEIAEILTAESSWINPNTNTYSVPSSINSKRIPESGYYEVVSFNTIKYVV
ncbi:nucleotidyltransferase [Tenacibaculum sp. M341]|uniref:nucleotidyltransferase n=1 Tax=Tenacibaculum sp. M341 TaxID=2530339 RepID=UPI0010481DEC|nr:nucleotidyltransferase [Tenacibaculum sp. M341]TCI93685.1 nucleotidyltransferase [Tenacibaculum sp. M341]